MTIRGMPRARAVLERSDRARLVALHEAATAADQEAERRRSAYRAALRRAAKKYPVAAIARELGVTPRAIWKVLGRSTG